MLDDRSFGFKVPVAAPELRVVGSAIAIVAGNGAPTRTVQAGPGMRTTSGW